MPDRDAALDREERDVDRLAALTAELVEMACSETRSTQLEKMELGPLIAEVLEDCGTGTRHDIRRKIGAVRAIACDRELLRRAIENVLRNAVRYSADASPIDITVSQDAEGTTISIRDFGPDVPEHALERIFT